MLKRMIQRAPRAPGCYLMHDVRGTVIYIGKAKDLRARLRSYLRPIDAKVHLLMNDTSSVEWIVTDTEAEALILEAELIQEHHPKYNIDLQSPGKYAYIQVTDEEYPRLIVARRRQGKRLMGPFPSAAARNALLREAHRLFRLCKEKRRVRAPSGSTRPCFRYRLGVCSGACIRAVPQAHYIRDVRAAISFLKGDFAPSIRYARHEMHRAAHAQQFEKAKLFRDQLRALEKCEQQSIARPRATDADAINYIVVGGRMTIQVFHLRRGVLSGRKTFDVGLTRIIDDNEQSALQAFLIQHYRTAPVPHEIIVPVALRDAGLYTDFLFRITRRNVTFTCPQRGQKRKLLELIKRNLLASYGERASPLYELYRSLRLTHMPERIACIDISHLGGTQTVGSLVQFLNGVPEKRAYRKFIITGVTGANDVAAIAEVVTRYGKRILEGKEKRPDLLVIDGGRGQLNAALRAIHDFGFELPAIGLAKRLEEIYVSWARVSLRLSPKNEGLQLLRALRDEAHRFAITFQRKRRRLR